MIRIQEQGGSSGTVDESCLGRIVSRGTFHWFLENKDRPAHGQIVCGAVFMSAKVRGISFLSGCLLE